MKLLEGADIKIEALFTAYRASYVLGIYVVEKFYLSTPPVINPFLLLSIWSLFSISVNDFQFSLVPVNGVLCSIKKLTLFERHWH